MDRIDDRPAVARRDDRDPAAAALLPVDLDALADLLARVLVAEGVTGDAEASLQLVSPDAIAALKAEHLGGSGPTDVLSFPIDGPQAPTTGSSGVDGGAGVAAEGDWMVGDVVVCPEVAADQAPGHAGDLDSELALLVAHGGLHLCGWDHAEADDRAAMWARERELLELLDAAPTRDPWIDDEAGASA